MDIHGDIQESVWLTRIGPGIDMSIPRFKVGDGSTSGGATTDFDVSISTLKIENDMSIP